MQKNIHHPGICAHAKALGVGHGHLRKVLDGDRSSPDLLKRYHALVESEKEVGVVALTAKREIPAAPLICLPPGASWAFDKEGADTAEARLGARARREGNTIILVAPIRIRGSELVEDPQSDKAPQS